MEARKRRVSAAGAAIAGALSFARVLVIAGAPRSPCSRRSRRRSSPPSSASAAAGLFLAWRSGSSTQAPKIELTNPFELRTVISFALLLGLISLVSKIATEYVGASASLCRRRRLIVDVD